MKVLSIAVLKVQGEAEPMVLSQASDLSSFGFFERRSVGEMLTFFSKTVVGRVKVGSRVTVDQEEMKEYQVHAFIRADGLAATATADREYPVRAAFTMLTDLLDEFAEKWPEWQTRGPPPPDFPVVQQAIIRCQNPANVDKLVKIQSDLDDTTTVLHKTIDNLLERGEKLDNLVERSDDLSKQSKMFYKQARKTNSCCVIS